MTFWHQQRHQRHHCKHHRSNTGSTSSSSIHTASWQLELRQQLVLRQQHKPAEYCTKSAVPTGTTPLTHLVLHAALLLVALAGAPRRHRTCPLFVVSPLRWRVRVGHLLGMEAHASVGGRLWRRQVRRRVRWAPWPLRLLLLILILILILQLLLGDLLKFLLQVHFARSPSVAVAPRRWAEHGWRVNKAGGEGRTPLGAAVAVAAAGGRVSIDAAAGAVHATAATTVVMMVAVGLVGRAAVARGIGAIAAAAVVASRTSAASRVRIAANVHVRQQQPKASKRRCGFRKP
jgi:hypothetical protein